MEENDDIQLTTIRWGSVNGDTARQTTMNFLCTVTENHGFNTRYTEHAIEDVSVITDHVRPELEGLTLEILVSNTPTRNYADDITQSVVEVSPDRKNFFTQPVNRVSDVWEKLRELSRSGTRLDEIFTSLRRYPSMVCLNASAPRAHDSYSSLSIALNLRNAEFVTLEKELGRVPIQPRGNRRKDKGGKGKDEASNQEKKKADEVSALAKGVDFFQGK